MMKIRIDRFNAVDRTVRAIFTDGDFRHVRPVNAVLKADGTHDAAATRARVEQVAAGVAAKRAAGVFAVTTED